MDPDDPHAMELFLEVYGTLPRAGPGGEAHTLRALGSVPGRAPGTVLDLGCGPGAQTVALARALPRARILALDLLAAMARAAERRFADTGVAGRVQALVGDMARPPVAPGSQDLIWCEGAIYSVGITEALRAWRPLLAGGGTVAFTEPIWLTGSPPQELRDWWLAEYPSLTDNAGVRSRTEAAGYRTLGSFPLPPSAWWDEYYAPMQGRIEALRTRLPHDPAALGVVAAAEAEIGMFRRFSDCYTYAFHIVRPAG